MLTARQEFAIAKDEGLVPNNLRRFRAPETGDERAARFAAVREEREKRTELMAARREAGLDIWTGDPLTGAAAAEAQRDETGPSLLGLDEEDVVGEVWRAGGQEGAALGVGGRDLLCV